MKNLLILDTETDGLDPSKDKAIEIAAVLWSLEHRCILAAESSLLHAFTNAAESTNGIPPAVLHSAPDRDVVLRRLEPLWQAADALPAHNAAFDRSFLPEYADDVWIDTCYDVEWPEGKPGSSLINLCLAHGVAVTSAHRALTDCLLLAALFERVAERHDLGALLERSLRPKAVFRALVSYKDRAAAKERGFKWIDGVWQRPLFLDDVAGLPFKAVRLDASPQEAFEAADGVEVESTALERSQALQAVAWRWDEELKRFVPPGAG